jgi:hypothetical protein
MIRVIAAVLLVATVAGCSSPGQETSEVSYRVMLERNAANICSIEPGMQKEQVTATMGVFMSRVRNGPLSNPWLTEFNVIDNTTCEVMYYLVCPHPPLTAILKRQATAVVLKDGVVVSVRSGAGSIFE